MSKTLVSLKSSPLRRAALAGAVALTALLGAAAPAAAMHGGMFMHHSFGGFGMHHAFMFDHHRHFRHDFAFASFGYFPSYDSGDYAYDDPCLRRVWGPYGWRLVDVCR